MRSALRQKRHPRTITSHSKSVPSPIGGWNARDALAEMPAKDAIALDNWMPGTSYCEIRGGYASHATGMTNAGKTLMVYNTMTGTNKMLCTTSSGTYDVSSAGAVGASVLARSNGKHQWVMFGDGSSNWLIAVNGADKPLYYDGTTYTAVDNATTPALTGLTTTRIIGLNVYKGRMFFIEKDSLSFWYLAAGAAGGALTEFDLSAECKKGGYLMAMATWTRDAGDGQDDVAVFLTSEGEAIVYQGNNPSVAANWEKVGSYFVGKPIGRRCMMQYGGDIILLTENGTFPLSQALQNAVVDFKMALSFKIENAFTSAARSYGSIYGWEAILYPAQSALIVNVPIVEDGEHEQYVMNTITKAWCRFTGWDAETFAVFNKELYFVSGTIVNKAWTGMVDGVDNIVAYGKQAFSYFGDRDRLKHFKMFRPILAVNGSLTYLTDIDVDFQDDDISATATYTVVPGGVWDTDLWDTAYWQSGLQISRVWNTPVEWDGKCAAGKIKVTTNSLTIQWMSSDYIYETGHIL